MLQKSLVLWLVLLLGDSCTGRCGCIYAGFRLLDKIDYGIEITATFSFGYQGTCPRVKGYYSQTSNDTVYLRAYYDVRGIWPGAYCTHKDTVFPVGVNARINYITVSYNEIGYSKDSLHPNVPDTLHNYFDSTFSLTALGISSSKNSNIISISPNPTSDFLTITCQAGDLDSITIFDLVGRRVLCRSISGEKEIINLEQLPAGLYQARITSNSGSFVRQILRQ